MKTLSDNDIVDYILKGGKWREKAIKSLFSDEKYYRQLAVYIKNDQGNDQDTEDIWINGILQTEEDIRSGKFKRLGSVRNYLLQTCKFLWNNARKKVSRKRELLSGELPTDTPNEDNPEKTTEQNDQNLHLIETLKKEIGNDCTEILILWKSEYSMQEIAEIMNLDDAEQAKSRRYRCFEKIMKKLENDPDWLSTGQKSNFKK